MRLLFSLVRLRQWPKNFLVFVPLLTSLQLTDSNLIFASLAGFIAFSLISASGYIFNDWYDRKADATHPLKQWRPLAKGSVNVMWAMYLAFLLFAAGSCISFVLQPQAFWLASGYIFLQLLYTLYLKRIVYLDVLVLAGFYLTRVWFGGIIIGTGVSFWLEAFAGLTFISLALQKRTVDILHYAEPLKKSIPGRDYEQTDLRWILPMGFSSFFAASVVFLLYIRSPEASILYSNRSWLLIPVLIFVFWISRLWIQTSKSRLREDAFTFAIKDVLTYCLAIVAAGFIWLAI